MSSLFAVEFIADHVVQDPEPPSNLLCTCGHRRFGHRHLQGACVGFTCSCKHFELAPVQRTRACDLAAGCFVQVDDEWCELLEVTGRDGIRYLAVKRAAGQGIHAIRAFTEVNYRTTNPAESA